MMDRIIYAYAEKEGLDYTLFRPFNWIGPNLDTIEVEKKGIARSLTLFISNILYHGEITLVDGGSQRRCFTCIDDAIEALMKIIANKNGCANNRIFNIGNPDNNYSIKQFVEILMDKFSNYPEFKHLVDRTKITVTEGAKHYGKSYQDPKFRVPAIKAAKEHLGWEPTTTLEDAIEKTLEYYLVKKNIAKDLKAA